MSRRKSMQASGPGLGIFFSEEKIPHDESTGWQAGSMVVSGLLNGSAAEKSGMIHTGDRLWAVGGQSVVGLKPQRVVDLISSVLEMSTGMQSTSRKSPRASVLDDTDKENNALGHSKRSSTAAGMKEVELTLQRLEQVGSSTRAVPYTVHIPFSSTTKQESVSKVARRSTRDLDDSRRAEQDGALTTEDLEAVPGKKRGKSSTPFKSLNSPRQSGGDRLARSQALSARKRQRQDNPPVEALISASEGESTVMVKRNGTLIKRENVDSSIRTEETKAASTHAAMTATVGGRTQEEQVFAQECKSLRESNCELLRRIEELERRAEANEGKAPDARRESNEGGMGESKAEGKRENHEEGARESPAEAEKARKEEMLRMPEAAVVSLEEERAELQVSAQQERLQREAALLSQQQEDISRHKAEVTRQYAEVARLREETGRREEEVARQWEAVKEEQEEVARERALIAGEREELASLEKELARQAEEVGREKAADCLSVSLRQQEKLMSDTHAQEEGGGGSGAVSQLQDRLKMAVGSARMAKEALAGERKAWAQTAALLCEQVTALVSVAREYGIVAQECADEMKSMDADRVFLEAEIVRQQEKQEKTAEQLRKSEEARVKAEGDIEELRRVVAKEERERERAEEEWRREQERAEGERERLCRRVEQLEDAAPLLQREPSVQLEKHTESTFASEGSFPPASGAEAERRASRILQEVLDAQSIAAEVARTMEEAAVTHQRAAAEGEQRVEDRVRRQERRRHSAIVAELRTELKKALVPPSLSPSPHSKSSPSDSLSLSQSTAASSKPSPPPPSAAEAALRGLEEGGGGPFLLPGSDAMPEEEKEKEKEEEEGCSDRLQALLPGEAAREEGEKQAEMGAGGSSGGHHLKSLAIANQDSGAEGGSRSSWNVTGDAV